MDDIPSVPFHILEGHAHSIRRRMRLTGQCSAADATVFRYYHTQTPKAILRRRFARASFLSKTRGASSQLDQPKDLAMRASGSSPAPAVQPLLEAGLPCRRDDTVVATCSFEGCGGAVTRKTPSVAMCENYRDKECRFKISYLAMPVDCKACAGKISPGHPCFRAKAASTNKQAANGVKPAAFLSVHYEWRHCIGKLVPKPHGKKAAYFVVTAEEGDSRIGALCDFCQTPILLGEKIVSSWESPPLHAKDCAKKVFGAYQHKILNSMLMEGVPKGAVNTEDLGFDF